jgi:hypothetical protein
MLESTLSRAAHFFSLSRFADAARVYQEAVSIAPKDPRSLAGLAEAMFAIGAPHLGIPRLIDLAGVYAETQFHDAALAVYDRVLGLSPDRLELHLDMAQVEREADRAGQATQRLERLAEVYLELGLTEEAAEICRFVSTCDGVDPSAEEAREEEFATKTVLAPVFQPVFDPSKPRQRPAPPPIRLVAYEGGKEDLPPRISKGGKSSHPPITAGYEPVAEFIAAEKRAAKVQKNVTRTARAQSGRTSGRTGKSGRSRMQTSERQGATSGEVRTRTAKLSALHPDPEIPAFHERLRTLRSSSQGQAGAAEQARGSILRAGEEAKKELAQRLLRASGVQPAVPQRKRGSKRAKVKKVVRRLSAAAVAPRSLVREPGAEPSLAQRFRHASNRAQGRTPSGRHQLVPPPVASAPRREAQPPAREDSVVDRMMAAPAKAIDRAAGAIARRFAPRPSPRPEARATPAAPPPPRRTGAQIAPMPPSMGVMQELGSRPLVRGVTDSHRGCQAPIVPHSDPRDDLDDDQDHKTVVEVSPPRPEVVPKVVELRPDDDVTRVDGPLFVSSTADSAL